MLQAAQAFILYGRSAKEITSGPDLPRDKAGFVSVVRHSAKAFASITVRSSALLEVRKVEGNITSTTQ